MDPNTYSTPPSGPSPPTQRSERLAALTAAIDGLAAEDLDQLPDPVLAHQVLELRQLRDRLDGQWLRRLATVDGRGAAGAETDQQLGSTAAWLRGRLRMGHPAAASSVRTARALFRGPLTQTATALCAGELSPDHAQVLAEGTQHLPHHLTEEAEPVLVATARRLDPPRLRQAVAHLLVVADPDGAKDQTERRHQRRGCGSRRPSRVWSRSMGSWSRRPASWCWRPWSRWPARPTPPMPAPGANAPPMPWLSWPPQPRGRLATEDRWSAAPAGRGRGLPEPDRSWRTGWGGRLGWAPGSGDVSAAGL